MNLSIQTRTVANEDVPNILDIYSYYVKKTCITFELVVPSMDEFRNRITKITENYPFIVALYNNEIVGYAYATSYKERSAYNLTVETSVYVKDGLQDNGIGRTLYTQLELELKNKHIVNMLACITYPNEKSIHFHIQFGFTQVGHFKHVGFKFDEWRDILWMQKSI